MMSIDDKPCAGKNDGTRSDSGEGNGAAIGCVFLWAAMMAALGCVLLLACGCTTTKYVPVETVQTRWRDREVSKTDSVTDSRKETTSERSMEKLTITVNESGDTTRTDREFVYLRDRALEKENKRLRKLTDSLQAAKTDSTIVREPYPVERKLSRWEKTKLDWGGKAILACAALFCAAAAWIIKRIKK